MIGLTMGRVIFYDVTMFVGRVVCSVSSELDSAVTLVW